MERFELTPAERFLVGTTLRGGTVVLRPTLLRRLMPVPSVTFAVMLSVAIMVGVIDNGSSALFAAGVAASATLVASTSLLTIAFMRSRVSASASDLAVRDRWRRRSWSWAEIERVGVADAWPESVRAVEV